MFIDLYARKVVGWSTGRLLRTKLVIEALECAIRNRRPGPNLIVHSDHGSQYTSKEFKLLLAKKGFQASLGTVGSCWDNAVAESFFSTFKKESEYQDLYEDRAKAIQDVSEYIEFFYNEVRLHSHLNYQSPSRFEENEVSLSQAA